MKDDETKLKNICDFYVITHKLKHVLRTGWMQWDISADRIESVAEHIYGTQMLAFAIISEFDVGGGTHSLKLEKVCLMLAMHELGETVVGDISVLEVFEKHTITKEEKHRLEAEAVEKILAPLNLGSKILELFNEFEAGVTKEAKFARFVDKLESDFQAKFYDEEGFADFVTPREGIMEKLRQERIDRGWTTFSKGWTNYDKEHNNYEGFMTDIANYLIENDIFTNDK